MSVVTHCQVRSNYHRNINWKGWKRLTLWRTYRHLTGRTEDDHEIPVRIISAVPRIKPCDSRIHVTRITVHFRGLNEDENCGPPEMDIALRWVIQLEMWMNEPSPFPHPSLHASGIRIHGSPLCRAYGQLRGSLMSKCFIRNVLTDLQMHRCSTYSQ